MRNEKSAGALHDLTGGYPPVYLIIGLTGLIGAAMVFRSLQDGPLIDVIAIQQGYSMNMGGPYTLLKSPAGFPGEKEEKV